jgi:hypothetical protein
MACLLGGQLADREERSGECDHLCFGLESLIQPLMSRVGLRLLAQGCLQVEWTMGLTSEHFGWESSPPIGYTTLHQRDGMHVREGLLVWRATWKKDWGDIRNFSPRSSSWMELSPSTSSQGLSSGLGAVLSTEKGSWEAGWRELNAPTVSFPLNVNKKASARESQYADKTNHENVVMLFLDLWMCDEDLKRGNLNPMWEIWLTQVGN